MSAGSTAGQPATHGGQSPWATHRPRALELRDRYPHAAEILTLYLALLDVWEESWRAAHGSPSRSLAGWATEHVLPQIVKATEAAGPAPLAAAVAGLNGQGDAAGRASADGPASRGEEMLAAWLLGAELEPVPRYLARAALRGPLEAVDVAAACAADPAPRGDRRCPRCGGSPQLSVRAGTDDPLVSGERGLLCARCSQRWAGTASACAFCGGSARTVLAEERGGHHVGRAGAPATVVFPHMSVEGCDGCQRYLIEIDLGRDPQAVPEVDELAALPLDLCAAERGLSKITPNLMGF